MALSLEHFYEKTKYRFQLTLLTKNVSLEQPISWVQLLEDVKNCSFIRGGELIITTGLSTGESEALFQLIQEVWKQGASGIILNTGAYIHTIGDDIIRWCNEEHFPLFSMPWDVHIADLTQDYCNEIISERRTMDLRSEALTAALTGADPSAYQEILPHLTHCYLLAGDENISTPFLANTILQGVHYGLCNHAPTITSSTIHCGLSSVITSPEQFTTAGRQALAAMKVSKIKDCHMTEFSSIGLYYAALAINNEDILSQSKQLLAPLTDSLLRQTFRHYLEMDGSIQAVAEITFSHRNTINYRMQKIKALLEDDLTSPTKRLEYLFAYILCDCEQVR